MLRTLSLSLILVAFFAPTAQADDLAADKISSSNYSFPTTINFCGQESIVMHVQMCNLSETPQFYEAQFVDSSPGYAECASSVVPSHMRWQPLMLIQPGECKSYPIEIYRPDELNQESVLCYWLRIGTVGNLSSWLGAKMIDNALACVDFYEEESHMWLHPATPVTFDFDITNNLFPEVINYEVRLKGPDGVSPQETVLINGQSSDAITGSVFLGEGESTRVSVELEWTDPRDMNFYELSVSAPMFDKGGYPLGEIASLPIGNATLPAQVTATTPVAASAMNLAMAPNPFNPRTTVSFEVRQFGPVTMDVLDVRGRLIRRLIDESLPVARHEATWDGMTDAGQPASSGTYLFRVTTPGGRSSVKGILLK